MRDYLLLVQNGIFANFLELQKLGFGNAKNFEAMNDVKRIGKHMVCAENSGDFIEVATLKYEPLGVIRWHSKWREYVWEQLPTTVMSRDCLFDLYSFMKILIPKRAPNAYTNIKEEK